MPGVAIGLEVAVALALGVGTPAAVAVGVAAALAVDTALAVDVELAVDVALAAGEGAGVVTGEWPGGPPPLLQPTKSVAETKAVKVTSEAREITGDYSGHTWRD
jgi:hypothetical protein